MKKIYTICDDKNNMKCKHIRTDEIGLCLKCGYNTKGITQKFYNSYIKQKSKLEKIINNNK